jgi:RNA polymerase-binding transcription factor DksA
MAKAQKPNLEPYIQKLKDENERVRRELADLRGETHTNIGDATGEITQVDNHPGDTATEMFTRERDVALESNLEEILRQCERALEKVEEGTYGYSDISGDFIGEERLDALPYATRTVEEQERIIGR